MNKELEFRNWMRKELLNFIQREYSNDDRIAKFINSVLNGEDYSKTANRLNMCKYPDLYNKIKLIMNPFKGGDQC